MGPTLAPLGVRFDIAPCFCFNNQISEDSHMKQQTRNKETPFSLVMLIFLSVISLIIVNTTEIKHTGCSLGVP